MVRKKYIDTITDLLVGYAGKIDSLAMTQSRIKIDLENETKAMKGKYTDAYIAEYKKNYKFPNFCQQMTIARNECKEVVDYHLKTIEKQLNAYFMAPVRQDFANKINSVKITGLQLSNKEFDMLAKSAKSYMEMRLLNQLAETRTKTEMKVSLDPDTREPKREKSEAAAPYNYIDVPDLDQCYKAFEEYKQNVYRLLNDYSGKNADLCEFLESGRTKNLSLTSDSYFRTKAAERFKNLMSQQEEILEKTGVKTSLTERDKKVIDTLIDVEFPSIYPDKVKNKVQNVASAMPEIGELLRLDERYSKYLED